VLLVNLFVCINIIACDGWQVRYISEAIVCINSLIYLIIELIEIRLQGLSGFIKSQVTPTIIILTL